MPLTIQQYLALPVGATVQINRDFFEVKDLEQIGDRMEPVLVNVDNAERLHAAIYTCHLMRLPEGQPGLEAHMHPAAQDSSPLIAMGDDLLAQHQRELELSAEALGIPQDDLFYCSEILTGRLEHEPIIW